MKTAIATAVAVMGAMMVYFLAFDYINAYLIRFANDSIGSLNEITTGRSDIWINYINAMLAVRMAAIGIVTYDNLWFYFVLIVLLSKEADKKFNRQGHLQGDRL